MPGQPLPASHRWPHFMHPTMTVLRPFIPARSPKGPRSRPPTTAFLTPMPLSEAVTCTLRHFGQDTDAGADDSGVSVGTTVPQGHVAVNSPKGRRQWWQVRWLIGLAPTARRFGFSTVIHKFLWTKNLLARL
jgi:hypothetical protein